MNVKRTPGPAMTEKGEMADYDDVACEFVKLRSLWALTEHCEFCQTWERSVSRYFALRETFRLTDDWRQRKTMGWLLKWLRRYHAHAAEVLAELRALAAVTKTGVEKVDVKEFIGGRFLSFEEQKELVGVACVIADEGRSERFENSSKPKMSVALKREDGKALPESDGEPKRLILNATTMKELVRVWGSDSEKWAGKSVVAEKMRVSIRGQYQDGIAWLPKQQA